MLSILLIVAYVISTSLGLVLLKLGTASGVPISFAENAIKFNFNSYSLIGLFLYVVSFVLYIYLISKFDLGFIIPLAAAFVYILIFGASYFIFHEVFTTIKIVAISLIMLGVILINIK